MRLVSWNVNGLRSVLNKGLLDFIESGKYDIVMMQEIKTDAVPSALHSLGYENFIFPSKKKGYSGTMSMSKSKPLSVTYGIGDKRFDAEGRTITLEYPEFFVINAYFPNSQHGLTRLDFKMDFNNKLEAFSEKLRKTKPVIVCGDFNVAHTEIDIARPKDNENNAGFTSQEREWMTRFLKRGYIDSYRMFIKDGGHYSWWTYRFNARSRNIGWRIDYFIVSDELKAKIRNADILENIRGSDHAPVYLEV